MAPPRSTHPRRAGVASLSPVLALLGAVLLLAAPSLLVGCTPKTPIQQENELPGTPQAVWDVVGAGDPSIQGFATRISVNKGETLSFKIDTDAAAYDIEIYRLGFYQGNGARLVATILPSAPLPQSQPACLGDGAGLVDCGNWSESASWAVPGTAMSGIYLARLRRTDTGGASHIVFVVRDDARNADLLFQTSDTTWQAHNDYGGESLYSGSAPEGRAFKVSYNRPFNTRAKDDGRHWLFNAEYPMLRWLEANGFDVAYTTGVDADRAPATLLNHKVFLSNGEDAYWSAAQRANVEAALAAGVNLAFFSGSKAFWKSRFEASIDGSGTSHRTLVSTRETLAGAVLDPAHPTWTGSWRDARFSPPGDGGRPENALAGSLFQIAGPYTGALQVSGEDGRLRLWRLTSVASIPLGDVATLAPGSLGAELDLDLDNGSRPPGLIGLSATPVVTPDAYLLDEGASFGPGAGTHKITMHRHPVSGALVFSAGTQQWAWGLDANHDRTAQGAVTSLAMQQATVNLLADMGVAPAGLQAGITYLALPSDTTPPTAVVTSPAPGTTVFTGMPVVVTGTASDLGGVVGGVEVSTDGGLSWHPATGRSSWSYTWLPGPAGAATIRARAIDDSVRLGASSAALAVTVETPPVMLVSIAVTPAAPTLAPLASQQLTATGTYSDASTQDLTAQVAWSSSNETVATVSAGGLASAVATGSATLTASLGAMSGNTLLTVQHPQPSITTTTLPPGAAGVAYSIALGASGGTPPYTWASTGALPPGITLDGGTGVLSGVPGAAGTFAFTAELTDGAAQTASQALEIVVAPAPLVSIAVTPATPTVIVGGTQQMTATGTYADAGTADLTTQVTWTSSAPAVATVDAAGLATTLTVGATTLTATLGPVSGNTLLTVAPPPLVLNTPPLPGGTVTVAYNGALTATGGTLPYTWSIVGALPPGLTLDPGTGAITGTPTAAGTYAFTAELADAGTQAGSQALEIVVAPAPLVSIAVTPATPTVIVGGTQQFIATGTYADAGTADLTTQVTWESSAQAVATVDAAGLATTLTVGATTLTATLGPVSGNTLLTVAPPPLVLTTPPLPGGTVTVAYNGALTATGGTLPYTWSIVGALPPGLTLDPGTGAITGTPTAAGTYAFTAELADAGTQAGSQALEIVVAPAPLVSIAVTPATPTVIVGGTQQFIATGTYADAGTADLTAQVTWTSSAPAVATVDAAGLATTLTVGATTLTATLGPVSGNTLLTVAPPPLVLTTPPLPSGTVTVAYNGALTATGGTLPYTWSIVGTLPPGLTLDPGTGAITGTPTAAGTYAFTAELADAGTQTGSQALEIVVAPAPLVSIAVTPATPTVIVGGTQAFVATGTYADAGTADLTAQVTWTSSAPAVATVDAAGLATTLTVGATTLTATLGPVSGNTLLTVAPPPLVLTTPPLPGGTVTVAYNGALTATGGTLPYTWSIVGTLPPGLVLDPGTGAITGTPTAAGVTSFVAQVTDAALVVATQPLDITVAPVPLVSLAITPDAPSILLGASRQFTATGTFADTSTQDMTSQVLWETSVPAVATITVGGLASGVAPGGTTISATFGAVSDTTTLSVTVAPLAITTATLPEATLNLAYAATLAATGGTPPYTFGIAAGLPPGVVLNPATGELSGTPTAAGVYAFTAQVTDAALQVAQRSLEITVPAPPSPIVAENALPGTPQAVWDVVGAGDPSIQGFATDISVNKGGTIQFKIDTDADDYSIAIYRLGYYQGNGARLVTTLAPSAALPQIQPPCLNDTETGLIDCGNWSVSASWVVPGTAVSGIYLARLERTDTSGASHVVFVVRDDARTSDIVFQTADTTWQAYNEYGGNSLYVGSPNGRARKVSYNRPFTTRAVANGSDWLFNSEYPMVRWLEANGYDVQYITGVDSDRSPSLLLNRKLYMSNGHDEYWSGAQRANVEAALAAGTNLAFFSGNKIFWKTRWEPSIDGASTPHRTLVCYKETLSGVVTDPAHPTWTGTWRDARFSPPGDGGRPENALGGSIFMVNGEFTGDITVTGEEGRMRFWRGTSLATLPLGETTTLAPGTLGAEVDVDLDNGFRPPGLVGLTSTPIVTGSLWLQDEGGIYGPGSGTHRLTLHRHPVSGAAVFATGTYQWSWGLDANHDRSGLGSATDVRMQQATVNLFADLGVAPGTLEPGLAYTPLPPDTTPPTAVITSPAPDASLTPNATVIITGTAADVGGVVGGVEVSTDGGATWHPASGRASWSYSWTASPLGPATLLARASDDSARLGVPSAPVPVYVGTPPCTLDCSIWTPESAPTVPDNGPDADVEVGVKFRAAAAGFVTGIRFYKNLNNVGPHVGHLWTSGGTLLASAPFTGETASGWQQVIFPAPVPVSANTVYVASYHAPGGHYANDEGFFTGQGVTRDNLEALQSGVAGPNGVFVYGPPGTFPTQSYLDTNYWVDVVFNQASLVSIAVTPPSPAIVAGATQQFTAVGTYSDASTQDLTAQAVWGTSNAAVATVAGGGLATGTGAGSATITATVGAVSGSATLGVSPAPPSVTTASLPAAAVGVAYTASLTGAGGTPPYAWTVAPGLPPGLVLNPSSGVISGIPTATGSFAFTAELTDAAQATASRPLEIVVAAAPLVALQVTPDAASIPAEGTQQYTATGTYADSSTQDLTAVVSWGAANVGVATISSTGLATAVAPGTTTITATLGPISDATSVTVLPGPNLAVFTSSLPSGTVTVAYAATLVGSGGTPPYTWAVIGSLPAGILLDANTGALTGTPTAAGFVTVVVEVTDAVLATATRPLFLNVAPAPLVSIEVTPAGPSVNVGQTQQLVATGTYADASTQDITGQVTWASSNPAIASVSGGGLATGVGVGTATISATRGELSAGTSLTVTAPPITITTASLPDAAFGVAYAAPPLAATGGALPYTWSIASGLPPGLSLDGSSGVISGIPSAGGVYAFTVQVTDANQVSVTRGLQITVPEVQTFTIWPDTTVPAVADAGDTSAVEVGIKFRSSESGFITGVRFYKAATNVGTHVGSLWTEAGELLATATFTDETASGWQQVSFGTPVAISADTTYVASYFTPSGHYSVNELYFASGQAFDNPPLRALSSFESGGNGVYAYGASSSFPTQSYLSSNYWVDVVFAGTPPPPLVSITVTPPSPTLTTGGGTQQFTATGTYADASTQNLTGQVVWGTSNAAVATVSATGLAAALTPGSVVITATLAAISGTADLSVQLGTLAVASSSLPPGTLGLPYTALLLPSGGIAPYAWSVVGALPPGLALDPGTGIVSGTPTAIGTFPFTAEVGDGSAQNASAPLGITIAAVPVLSSIEVTPASPALLTGASQQLTATGTLSNGATQDVTGQVAWSTTAASVATVDASGLATAFNPGTATLTATLGEVSGSTSLTATAGAPDATEGPGGPILVITHPGNPYSRYLAEILRAEGFHAFSAMDMALVTPAVLAGHDVVLLGDFPLTAAQAAMLDAWVATGGNLIAMRPDKQLAPTFGLSDVAATLQNAYLQVATGSGPGVGIVGDTIQYKGTADLYALDGATAVATLFATATTPTAAPAVTLYPSLLGQAAAFTYDLARSVAQTRQGNPAWGGTTRSGVTPIRPVELFYGAAAGDPQPDWVDLGKVQIPQADEQQRLLANLILQMNLATRPLPRFWYLPSSHKAVIVMTGDDHNNGGTAARFNSYLAESTPGCSVDDWECIRSTSYIYTGSLSTSQAQFYEGLGFEVALHVDTGCSNWLNEVALGFSYGVQLGVFATAYPGVPAPTTNRTHCVVWSDYDTQPQVELANGIRLDTTYYYFPGAWVGDRPGFMTGSGIPMRFTDRRGALIDVYQAATQMTDESAQTYPLTVDTLLDNALGSKGYYGVFTANMHTDSASPLGGGAASWTGSYAIVDSARTRGVPIVSARQMLQWLDGRNASSFSAIAWDGSLLSFGVTAGAGANNLRGMLPLQVPGKTLNVLLRDGNPISFTTATIKGVAYAIFPATTGAYQATYQ